MEWKDPGMWEKVELSDVWPLSTVCNSGLKWLINGISDSICIKRCLVKLNFPITLSAQAVVVVRVRNEGGFNFCNQM
ncbi:hypothetical protein SERLA73DRAFT_70010 [Serpula lacrymans var. lacrymans S7.3]|uniref:Uncharacterized protein n=1 Tax=Serpula lacrymans var. lacrymans (strain S7.3) TaxID=936435 RepID=F8PLM8_SERL3|nr:hypothetical protein SERLA73DRAFT_70010 [Serpula lacrymans var. lacrymans S7.3]